MQNKNNMISDKETSLQQLKVNEIQGIIKNINNHKTAMNIVNKLFEQIINNDSEIKNAKVKQVVEEKTLLDKKYLSQQAIVIEWGKKVKPTKQEKQILLKRNRLNRYISKFTYSLFDKNIPKSITFSNYRYICFHFNQHQIIFPHNPEFTPIDFENFIANPKIIYPNIASALNNPSTNLKNLKLGKDY